MLTEKDCVNMEMKEGCAEERLTLNGVHFRWTTWEFVLRWVNWLENEWAEK